MTPEQKERLRYLLEQRRRAEQIAEGEATVRAQLAGVPHVRLIGFVPEEELGDSLSDAWAKVGDWSYKPTSELAWDAPAEARHRWLGKIQQRLTGEKRWYLSYTNRPRQWAVIEVDPAAPWLEALWSAQPYPYFFLKAGARSLAFMDAEDACEYFDNPLATLRQWKFPEVAGRSGDSTLLAYRFADGMAEVDLEWYEPGITVRLRIPTAAVLADEVSGRHEIGRVCFIEVTALAEALRQERGHYVPGKGFGRLMQEARRGLSLAYGRKSSKVRYLVSFRGSSPLFSCLVSDPDEITVTELP